MARKLSGGCACGSIRYQLLARPMFVNCCHCDDCQRLTGSADFVINASHRDPGDQAAPRKAGGRSGTARGDGAHDIYRCRKCQTALWSDYGHKTNVRFVRVGTLDDPGALEPDAHIFTRWKVKWLKLPKTTPSFRDYYDTAKLWPKASFGTPERRARQDRELT